MTTEKVKNFQPGLACSKKQVREGDVFVALIEGHGYIYGRVVKSPICFIGETKPSKAFCTVYFYRHLRPSKLPIPPLTLDDVLIPPLITNRQGWLRGYFETIAATSITSSDRYPIHCFRTPILERGWRVKRGKYWYYNDEGNILASPTEPCGQGGVWNVSLIFEGICEALGIS